MNSKSFPSESTKIPVFDYGILDQESRLKVQAQTSKLKSLIRRSARDIIDIGQHLMEVKSELGHGHFDNWLSAEFSWSASTARKFMQVSEKFKSVKCTDLTFAVSALYLLARPSVSEDARTEAIEKAKQGENISFATAKEIVARHKGLAGQPPALTNDLEAFSEPKVTPKTKVKKQPETPKEKGVQRSKLAIIADLNFAENADDQLAEYATIDVPAVEIPEELDVISQAAASSIDSELLPPQFRAGDRVRILCRQEGEDKWTGCIAQIWEITPSGWLRVNVEGHQGVKFTLKPEWVELLETFMPDDINQTTRASDLLQRKVRIPVDIGGQTIEIEGIAKSVEVEWEHDGQRGVAFVPIDELIISTKQ